MSLKLVILLQLCNIFLLTYAVQKTCPSGTFASDVGSEWCFTFADTPGTFKTAQLDCKQRGGHLVRANDEEMDLFLFFKAREKFGRNSSFWIGGQILLIQTANNDNKIWSWTDNSVITYFNWVPNSAIYPYDDKNCISVLPGNGYWSPQNCSTELPYVCQIPSEIGVCESGWTYFDKNYKCHKTFNNASSILHADAEKKCVELGAHLPSIHSQDEHDFLVELTSVGRDGRWSDVGVYTGGISDGNNTWSWTDGSPFDFTNWSQIDPDRKESKSVIVFYPDGQVIPEYSTNWDDVKANDGVKRFVCQKDAIFV